ncbi:MAG: urease accessory protein UreE, partial [Marinobacter sp.]
MLELIKRMDRSSDVNAMDTLTLPYELRIRGRLKAVTDSGRDVGLFLDRGPVLRHGD